ncbi:MAG: hypothetical protein ACXWKG_13375 [Limisphaerales bacterium]
MAKNRKSDAAVRFAPAIKALLLCAFFVTAGVGYVWYKNQISLLGHQIKERENRLADLERGNKVRRDNLAALCSPVKLIDLVRTMNLGLGPPAETQKIRLVDGPVQTQQPSRTHASELARRD